MEINNTFPWECSLICPYFVVYPTRKMILGESDNLKYVCEKYNLCVQCTDLIKPYILVDCER